jgi:hypothetical protein
MPDAPACLALLLIVLPCFAADPLGAQQEPKVKELPDAPMAKQQSQPQQRENFLHSTIVTLSRRSIVFPEIATDPNSLGAKKKFKLFVDESITPFHFLTSAASSGINQARDALPGYGQGMSGYGKRFGSSLATSTSNSLFGTFLLSSMLRRDPRYFVTMRGGFKHRVAYALSRIVVTRTDDGRLGANWPGLFSPLMAEGLANSYLPVKERTAGRTFQRYGLRIGLNTASTLLREYWPTIFRSLGISKTIPASNSNSTPAPAPPSTPSPWRPERDEVEQN